MYRCLPQDIRPMGVNNLNQLVHHHLGSESFDVVAQIRANLPWLYELHQSLGAVTRLAPYATSFEEIGKHSQTLWAIAESMPALQRVYDNLTPLVQAGTSLKEMSEKYKTILAELEALHGQVSQAAIQDLLSRYSVVESKLAANENILTELAQVKQENTTLSTALQNTQKAIEKLSLQNTALNLVLHAQETQLQSDIQAAKEAVRKSKVAGNDETLNTARLEEINNG